jgi:hypothetical protein
MPEIRTLTVRQPWATLIAKGVKDVENRTWHTKFRGLLAIHAGQNYDRVAHMDPVAMAAFVDDDRVRKLRMPLLPKGSIIAVAELPDPVPWPGSLGLRLLGTETANIVLRTLAQ